MLKNETVKIITGSNFAQEKHFILSVFVEDFLGMHLDMEFLVEKTGYELIYQSNCVQLNDVFFGDNYFNDKTHQNLKSFNLKGNELPAWFYDVNTELDIKVDIFGMAFFIMSGYADIHFSQNDEFERNIGYSSFLVQKQLIDRPIIQEWFTVLACELLQLSETDFLSNRLYSKHVSHDVDQPFEYLNYTYRRLLKRLIGDVVIRRDFNLAIERVKFFHKVKGGDFESDPYNNFEELIDLLAAFDIRSAFFFVASDNDHPNDVNYQIHQKPIKQIVKKVHNAGHKIGIHPSFNTLGCSDKLSEEVKALNTVLNELQIKSLVNESRKHYLRWDWKTTPKELSDAGIEHDYTVGYADRTGFRAGVAFPYSAFDWINKKILPIKIHPLIVMECSLLNEGYMGVSYKEASEIIGTYHTILKKLGGEFVFLWHNHLLIDKKDIQLFNYFLGL
ncbi:MAG: polysaccharide deacetylase family protein [Balneolaceae bacterium]|nr:polysaccharide deacetylase family protein [Balneolaceae bacterium]